MIELTLLTGFLGAGKTTLLRSLLKGFENEKIGVIINEFGEINIDGVLLQKDGVEMRQLSNGSIFCACIKDKFVTGLIEMSGSGVSRLFIEASGLADPASMERILEGIREQLHTPYDYRGAICVVDAETYLDLQDVLPALRSQVEYSGAVVINKADLAGNGQVEAVSAAITELNAGAGQYVTSFCRLDFREILRRLSPVDRESRESTNTVESRPKTFVLRSAEPVERDSLLRFLRAAAPSAYRIKGFCRTVEDGMTEVSAVGTRIELRPWEGDGAEPDLVVISSVGIRMMSLIAGALEDCGLRGKLTL